MLKQAVRSQMAVVQWQDCGMALTIDNSRALRTPAQLLALEGNAIELLAHIGN